MGLFPGGGVKPKDTSKARYSGARATADALAPLRFQKYTHALFLAKTIRGNAFSPIFQFHKKMEIKYL